MKELRTTKDKLLEIIGDFAVDDLGIDRLLDRGRVETFQKKKNNRHLLQEISLAEYEAKI